MRLAEIGSDWQADAHIVEAAMPDHLSIEVLGVLRGSADGPLAVALLGSVTLAALLIIIGRPLLKYVAARKNS